MGTSMKMKLGTLFFAFAVSLAAAQTPDTRWYANAIAANPGAATFTVSTADELAGLAAIVNGTWGGEPGRDGFEGKTVRLAGNVDLSSYGNWVPIGSYDRPFSGMFDGGRHGISKLTINHPDTDRHGLFGCVNSGKVVNLGLDSVKINGGRHVGSVVGELRGSSVVNCYSTGTVSSTGDYGYIGGVVARVFNSDVVNCYSTAVVSSTGVFVCVGGVAGGVSDNSSVTSCYSTGAVSGGIDANSRVGGVVGNFTGDSVTNCAALNPEVKGTGANAGRVAGYSGRLLNNVAFSELANNAGNTTWANKDADSRDGESITVTTIGADGTIGGRFTEVDGWTTESGKLPGFGGTVEFPAHFSALAYRVTLSPAHILVGKGGTQQFTATVLGESENKTVTWTMSGNSSSSTAINAAGLLSVAEDETSATLTVTAIPMINTGLSATATVTVVAQLDTRWYTNAIAADPNETTFTISTAGELAGLAAIVNGGWGGEPERDSFAGKTVRLTGNIDLSPYDNWIPIGSFSGTFNGGGHVISKLTINRPNADNQGLFGNISGGRVENLGLDSVNINGRDFVGGVAGDLLGSSVTNSYSTGVVNGRNYVGGVVGAVSGTWVAGVITDSDVVNSYFIGVVSGTGEGVGGVAGFISGSVANSYAVGAVNGGSSVGGVVGLAGSRSSVTKCYSASAVSGTYNVGGVVGYAGFSQIEVASDISVTNCAALNSEVKGNGAYVGRVVGLFVISHGDDSYGTGILSNNIAYAEMKNNAGNTTWTDKGTDKKDGADVTAGKINADGTINGLFVDTDVWTTEPGRLPGLFGETVEMPAHLKAVAVAFRDRVIPPDNGRNDVAAVVAPVNTLTAEFTAGPNPATKSAGMINFYYDTPNNPAGTTVPGRLPLGVSGVLTIYSASGSAVNKIKIKITPDDCCRGGNLPPAASVQAKRQIGSWDLRDSRGRPVSEGAYLVRGVLKLSNGKSEKVSLVLGIW